MARVMTRRRLARENLAYRYTGGVSGENRCRGFLPAFRDLATGMVYPSLCASGAPVPFHCLDGLPDDLVLERDDKGSACLVKPTVEAGFVRDGDFYTREQAAACVSAEE